MIKTMSNKMAINTYLSTTESKKLSKQEQRIMDTENVLMVARWEVGVREWVKSEGIKKYQYVVTEYPWGM